MTLTETPTTTTLQSRLARVLAYVSDPLTVARWVAIIGQLGNLHYTQKLWNSRTSPATLPVIEALGTVSFTPMLAATALSALFIPRIGAVVHALVIVTAILGDETRIQPTLICHATIILCCAFGPKTINVARAYLVAMWFFAGFHKLLSPAFFRDTAPWILQGLSKHPPVWLSKSFGWVLCVGEMALGLLAFIPKTRRLAAIGAVALHIGIFATLGPWGHRWNTAVWPWNLAMALIAPLLFWPWRESLRQSVQSTQRWLRPMLAVVLIGPALLYLGLQHPYLSHHLYTDGLPTTEWCSGEDLLCTNDRGNDEVYSSLNVPLPPTHHTLAEYFRRNCAHNDRLTIREPRRFVRARGITTIELRCPR